MVWYSFLIIAAAYVWALFADWVRTIFVIPFQNMDMLWLLVPVWIAWFFAEFFQEKKGTSMGNAISNAVVILWGSIDCARQTTYWISKHPREIFEAVLRFGLITLIFAYGTIIVWLGIKGNKLIRYIGRIREITYVFVMFVPIFYGAISFSWNHVIGAVVFFPLFYFIIEVFDRHTPNPKAIDMDNEGNENKSQEGSFIKQPVRLPPQPMHLPPQNKPEPMRLPIQNVQNRSRNGQRR
jgi:hypothetical protein